jgi:hypothetical protein
MESTFNLILQNYWFVQCFMLFAAEPVLGVPRVLAPWSFLFAEICHKKKRQTPRTIQTALAEKISLTMDSDNCFLTLIGTDGDLDLAFLYVKDGIGRISLREDDLIFPVVRYGPAAVHGGEKLVDVEGRLFRCFHCDAPFSVSRWSIIWSIIYNGRPSVRKARCGWTSFTLIDHSRTLMPTHGTNYRMSTR